MSKRKVIQEHRGFKGIWIPSHIWLNESLSIQEIVFLAEIDSLDISEKGCFASNKYFSEFFGLSKNRCSEIIKSLEEKGTIRVFYEYSKENPKQVEKRIIRLIGKSNRGIRNLDRPYSEKREDNNTSINNTKTIMSNSDQLLDGKSDKSTKKVSNKQLEEDFSKLWKLYPNKKGKKKAFESYKRAIKKGVTNKTIQNGIVAYKKEIRLLGTPVDKQKHGSTWFNNESWDDEYTLPGNNGEKTATDVDEIKRRMEEQEKYLRQLEDER